MLWFWISVAVGVIGNLWLVFRVSRVSKSYAFVTFLFFPAAIFLMFKYWGDPDHDIKFPFIVTLVATIVFGYQSHKLEQEYEAEVRQEQSER
jgi:hypothetical protein